MFRRIELIHPVYVKRDGGVLPECKTGLMGAGHQEVIEAWIDDLRGPFRPIPKNARFYFTERGWREVGRKVIATCRRVRQDYRVIAVKENAVHVVWRDKFTGYEIAAQPRKERD